MVRRDAPYDELLTLEAATSAVQASVAELNASECSMTKQHEAGDSFQRCGDPGDHRIKRDQSVCLDVEPVSRQQLVVSF